MLSSLHVQRIRQLTREGLSQRQIAKRTGISRKTIHRIQTGKRPDHEDTISLEDELFTGPPGRCPTCGATVYLPCIACQVRCEDVNATIGALTAGRSHAQRLRFDAAHQSRAATQKGHADGNKKSESVFAPEYRHHPGQALSENDHFLVVAGTQDLADEVLSAAESMRNEIANRWLGETLPRRQGATLIHARLSPQDDDGMFWAIDRPRRRYHEMWLTTSRKNMLGATLRHEMVHVVLATRYPHRLPAFWEEGIACQEDGSQRASSRRKLLSELLANDSLPPLKNLLIDELFDPGEPRNYAIAMSLVQWLLQRGSREMLVRFVVEGQQTGWDHACRHLYRLASLQSMQTEWQASLAN